MNLRMSPQTYTYETPCTSRLLLSVTVGLFKHRARRDVTAAAARKRANKPQRLCSPGSAAPRPVTPTSRHQAEHSRSTASTAQRLVRAALSTHRVAGHRAHPRPALLAPAAWRAMGAHASQAGTAKAAAVLSTAARERQPDNLTGPATPTARVLLVPDSQSASTPHVELHRTASADRQQALRQVPRRSGTRLFPTLCPLSTSSSTRRVGRLQAVGLRCAKPVREAVRAAPGRRSRQTGRPWKGWQGRLWIAGAAYRRVNSQHESCTPPTGLQQRCGLSPRTWFALRPGAQPPALFLPL